MKQEEEKEDVKMLPTQCTKNQLCIRKPDFMSGKHRGGCKFKSEDEPKQLDDAEKKVIPLSQTKGKRKALATEPDVGSSVSTAGVGTSRNDAIAVFSRKWEAGEITKLEFETYCEKLA